MGERLKEAFAVNLLPPPWIDLVPLSCAVLADVIDITEAQAREAERRRVVDSVSIGSGSSGSAVVLNNGPGPSSLAYDEEAVR